MAGLLQAAGTEKTFPVRLVIPAKPGGVTFLHFRHAQRMNFECATCHATTWPQDSSASLGYKHGGHREAEGRRTACAGCHREGGRAFASQGNCTTRCHARYAGDAGRPPQAGQPPHAGR
jgi:hypothetical protein